MISLSYGGHKVLSIALQGAMTLKFSLDAVDDKNSDTQEEPNKKTDDDDDKKDEAD